MKFIARVHMSGVKKLVTIPAKLTDIKSGDYVTVIPDRDLCSGKYQIEDSPKPYKPFTDEEEEEEIEQKPIQNDENPLGKEGLKAANADHQSNNRGLKGVSAVKPRAKPKPSPINNKPKRFGFLGWGIR